MNFYEEDKLVRVDDPIKIRSRFYSTTSVMHQRKASRCQTEVEFGLKKPPLNRHRRVHTATDKPTAPNEGQQKLKEIFQSRIGSKIRSFYYTLRRTVNIEQKAAIKEERRSKM